MARKGEPDLTGMYASVAVGGALMAQGMLAAAPAIGQAIGSAIFEARRQNRLNNWQKAILAKSEEADELLTEFDALRRDSLGPYSQLTQRAVKFYMTFKSEHAAVFDRESVFAAYDDLTSLVGRIRAEIAHTKEVARQLFNARVQRQAAKLIREVEEAA